jgi:hypothetical protein
MADLDDDELLDALGVELPAAKAGGRTPREERLIAGFEDILRFHQAHGRAPRHGEAGDIFERLYAVRLDRLRQLPEARALLAELDVPGLLSADAAPPVDVEALDEDALLAELGVASDTADEPADERDITTLRHVRPHAARQAADEIAGVRVQQRPARCAAAPHLRQWHRKQPADAIPAARAHAGRQRAAAERARRRALVRPRACAAVW